MDYWHKQTPEKPLYDALLWSRPENRAYAGKLLVVGGSSQGFAHPAQAYQAATVAGVGSGRAVLPDALQKTLPKGFMEADFLPSTPSGSFAREALGELLSQAMWADGVLLAGDLGRNSETAILLESFAGKYSGQLTLTCDAADYAVNAPHIVLKRPDTLLVVGFKQLQKFGLNARFPQAFTSSMDFLRLVEMLHDVTAEYPLSIITKHSDNIFVASGGQVSTTKIVDKPVWRITTAASASVWWLQNPQKPFEALSTSVVA
jgi:hypothetical protein